MRALRLAFFVLLSLAGCGGPYTREIEVAKQKWAAQPLRSSYQFEFTQRCFCRHSGQTMVIQVEGDHVVSVVRKEDGGVVGDELGWRPTIDALLAEVEKANSEASSLRVSFDSAKGFPASVFIDWMKDAVDDEESYEVTNVRAVQK